MPEDRRACAGGAALSSPDGLEYVDSDEAFAQMLGFLEQQESIAFDTESNSMYAYRERVCLVQCTAAGRDFIIDPFLVDIRPLGPIFADAGVEKIFHAAEYDVFCLRREFDFDFSGLFDTMVSARILGWKKVGLASQLEEHFGVRLDKKMQRYDWGRRPLSAEALAYARLDTVHLLELRNIVHAALRDQERLEEARAAFDRVSAQTPPARAFNPEGFWRLKRLREVPKAALARFRALYIAREEIGRLTDRAVHRVISEQALVDMAQQPPRRRADLERHKGVDRRLVARHAPLILDALSEAETSEPPIRPPKADRPAKALTDRVDRLKAWRKGLCDARGVESDVVLPNKSIAALAAAAPTDPEGLHSTGLLDAWQLERYGTDVLEALTGAADSG